LMDLQMPVMGGLEATEEILSEYETKDIAIIAMTANAMASDREQCLAAGMKDHIPKPIDPNDLYDKLRRWLDLKVVGGAKEIEGEVDIDLSALDNSKYIDKNSGLKSTAGKSHLYAKILNRFVVEEAQIVTAIENALFEDESETAVRMLHTLKGLSATIGALTLHEKAKSAEAKVKDGDGLNSVEIKTLNEEMKGVIESIEVLKLS